MTNVPERLFKCYGCGEILPESSFSRDNSRSGQRNVSGKCRTCKALYQKALHITNPRKYIEYSAGYYERNRKVHLQRMSLWRRQNPDRMLAYWHNYKARLKANGPYDLGITRPKLFTRDGGMCQICQTVTTYKDCSIDHVKPASKGGTHTWGNVQLAHKLCNIRKGAKYHVELV